VFFGDERWRRAADAHTPAEAKAEAEHEPAAATGHGAHGDFRPHESPSTMAIPLIALAVLSTIGGALNLPFGGFVLEHFLHPVFGDRLREVGIGSGTKFALGALAVVIGLIGIAIGYLIYVKHTAKPVEPTVLRRAWYVDDLYDDTIATPGRRLAAFSADVIDAEVIDGAVNGVGTLVRVGGSGLRRVQSGFVRNYALAVAIGAVGILAYMVARS
jgi:NADH-quinone oxidoreductase subunit L